MTIFAGSPAGKKKIRGSGIPSGKRKCRGGKSLLEFYISAIIEIFELSNGSLTGS
ncbi:MAG: hypothetical protein IIA14_14990 [SAR324 cluster bacterium]|nr:hypothetical protein [SAR324 cluster bacterium]